MKEFIDNVKILIKTLGYNVLDVNQKPTNNDKLLYCKGNGADAIGFLSANGFTVLKGSVVSDHVVDSLKTNNPGYFDLRAKLEEDKIIVDRKLVKDYGFSSPSAASAIFLGRPSNGNTDWKTSKSSGSKCLKEVVSYSEEKN